MNLCRACNEDFGSVTAFDKHRVGKHAYPYSKNHEDGRRCLAPVELTGMGWNQDSHGRWRTPQTPSQTKRLRILRASEQ